MVSYKVGVKYILTSILLSLVIFVVSGCVSAKDVSSTAWFKDYNSFEKQAKELDIKGLKPSEKEKLIESAALSKYQPCKKIKYIISHGGELPKKHYTKIFQYLSNYYIIGSNIEVSYNALQCLIDQGADVNAKRYDGQTVAIRHLEDKKNPKSLEFIKFLVKNGADLTIKDSKGHDPLYYAKLSGNKDIYNYILSKVEPKKYNVLTTRDQLNIDDISYVSLNVPTEYSDSINCKAIGYKDASNVERYILSKSAKLGNVVCVVSNKVDFNTIDPKDILEKKELKKYNYALIKLANMKLDKPYKRAIIFGVINNYNFNKTKDILDDFKAIGISFDNLTQIDQGLIVLNIVNKYDTNQAKTVLNILNKLGVRSNTAIAKNIIETQSFENNTLLDKLQTLGVLSATKVVELKHKAIAKKNGYANYEDYIKANKQLSEAKAHGYNSWSEYQKALLDQQRLAEAKANGYNSWYAYKRATSMYKLTVGCSRIQGYIMPWHGCIDSIKLNGRIIDNYNLATKYMGKDAIEMVIPEHFNLMIKPSNSTRYYVKIVNTITNEQVFYDEKENRYSRIRVHN